jgi:hypothetical protein
VTSALTDVRALLNRDRPAAISRLNELFRLGELPVGLEGRKAGELVALEFGPALDDPLTRITDQWMPWQGKTFDSTANRGDNIFDRSSLRIARVFNPFYNDFVGDGPERYRAYAFRTYTGPGLEDPEVSVLKIDYDLPENPGWNIRRVLDELVRIDEGTYLGKAHVRWWWGTWQRVAFFLLRD